MKSDSSSEHKGMEAGDASISTKTAKGGKGGGDGDGRASGKDDVETDVHVPVTLMDEGDDKEREEREKIEKERAERKGKGIKWEEEEEEDEAEFHKASIAGRKEKKGKDKKHTKGERDNTVGKNKQVEIKTSDDDDEDEDHDAGDDDDDDEKKDGKKDGKKDEKKGAHTRAKSETRDRDTKGKQRSFLGGTPSAMQADGSFSANAHVTKSPMSRNDGLRTKSGKLRKLMKTSSWFFWPSTRWGVFHFSIDPIKGLVYARKESDLVPGSKGRHVIPFDEIKNVSLGGQRGVDHSATNINNKGTTSSSTTAIKRQSQRKIATVTSRRRAGGNSTESVGKAPTRFYINLTHSAKRRWRVPQIVLEATDEEDAMAWVDILQEKILLHTRVFTVGLHGEFPENSTPRNRAGHRVGIAFSGGGGRAHVCTTGHMRALHHLGLLDSKYVDYLSSVSASAWTVAIYQFYDKGVKTDEELFGPLVSDNLSELTLERLSEPACPLSQLTTIDMWKQAKELVWSTNPHELWEKTVGKIYLKPFGLNKDIPFCRGEDLESIKRRNPQLTHTKFNTTKIGRPFWISGGTIIGPEWARVGELVPVQFTAMYSGVPYLHRMHFVGKHHRTSEMSTTDAYIGGAMIESFAFGGPQPEPEKRPGLFSARSTQFKLTGTSQKLLGGEKSKKQRTSSAQDDKLQHQDAAALQEDDAKADQAERRAQKTAVEHTPQAESPDAHLAHMLGPSMIRHVFKFAKDKLTDFGAELGNIAGGREHGAAANEDFYEGVIVREIWAPRPEKPFTLRHALGISSDAPGVNMHDKRLYHRLNPQGVYWSPLNADKKAVSNAMTYDFGDGGSLDNTGLLALLQRKVRRCVLFLNTTKLLPIGEGARVTHNPSSPRPKSSRGNQRRSLRKDGGSANGQNGIQKTSSNGAASSNSEDGSDDAEVQQQQDSSIVDASGAYIASAGNDDSGFARRAASKAQVHSPMEHRETHTPSEPHGSVSAERAKVALDTEEMVYDDWQLADLVSLFGVNDYPESVSQVADYSHNQVFHRSRLRGLLSRMQAKWLAGEPVIVTEKYEVLHNAFWGIDGDWETEVMWIYLEDSSEFRKLLAPDVQEEMSLGLEGEFARFPNYKTYGQRKDHFMDLSLSQQQVNLLDAFAEWSVLRYKDDFKAFLTERLAPPTRKKKKEARILKELELDGFL